MNKPKRILIQMAMFDEARPLREIFNFTQEQFAHDSVLFDLYKTTVDQNILYLVIPKKCLRYDVSRVGSLMAALVAWAAIELLQPDLMINMGTAGGFQSKGAKIGDVYLADKATYHDREFHPIRDAFKKYSVGDYPVCFDEKWVTALALKKGIVSSGNRMLLIDADAKQMEKNQAVAKDMEAAAIAEVTELKNIPIIILKSITDLVDIKQSSHEQFDQNFHLAVEQLIKKAQGLILLLGK